MSECVWLMIAVVCVWMRSMGVGVYVGGCGEGGLEGHVSCCDNL